MSEEMGGVLLVRVSTGAVQRTKLDRSIGEEVASSKHADPDALDAICKIWPKGTLTGVLNVMTSFSNWNRKVMTLDFSGPLRLLPACLFMDHAARLREAKGRLEAEAVKVADSEENYHHLLARCRSSRGELFHEELYPPTLQAFRSSFMLDADYIPLMEGNDIVSRYQKVLGVAAEELAEKTKEATERAIQDGSRQILDRFRPALQRLVDVLGADQEKRIYDTLLGSVHELINVIPSFNKVLNDPQLEEWHRKISSVLLPMNTGQLRNADVGTRKAHAQRVGELINRLDEYQAIK